MLSMFKYKKPNQTQVITQSITKIIEAPNQQSLESKLREQRGIPALARIIELFAELRTNNIKELYASGNMATPIYTKPSQITKINEKFGVFMGIDTKSQQYELDETKITNLVNMLLRNIYYLSTPITTKPEYLYNGNPFTLIEAVNYELTNNTLMKPPVQIKVEKDTNIYIIIARKTEDVYTIPYRTTGGAKSKKLKTRHRIKHRRYKTKKYHKPTTKHI